MVCFFFFFFLAAAAAAALAVLCPFPARPASNCLNRICLFCKWIKGINNLTFHIYRIFLSQNSIHLCISTAAGILFFSFLFSSLSLIPLALSLSLSLSLSPCTWLFYRRYFFSLSFLTLILRSFSFFLSSFFLSSFFLSFFSARIPLSFFLSCFLSLHTFLFLSFFLSFFLQCLNIPTVLYLLSPSPVVSVFPLLFFLLFPLS